MTAVIEQNNEQTEVYSIGTTIYNSHVQRFNYLNIIYVVKFHTQQNIKQETNRTPLHKVQLSSKLHYEGLCNSQCDDQITNLMCVRKFPIYEGDRSQPLNGLLAI